MIIDCCSDFHGHYPKLDGGDLLIVAGDLTARDTEIEYLKFFEWLTLQKYRKIIFIAGNHDNYLQSYNPTYANHIQYLCDSGTTFENLRIYGSPWTKKFEGMNPRCMAFTCDTEEELSEKWQKIPDDVDILVTHGPPFGIFDETFDKRLVGSTSLLIRLAETKPLVHCFGHIHEKGGKDMWLPWKRGTTLVNCSLVNERYQPVNKPVRIIL